MPNDTAFSEPAMLKKEYCIVCTHQFVHHSPVDGYRGCFKFSIITNELLLCIFVYKCLYEHRLSFLLDKIPGSIMGR